MVGQAKRALKFKEMSIDRMAAIAEGVAVEDDAQLEENTYTGNWVEVAVNEFWEVHGGISVPRGWAINNWNHLRWADRTVNPKHRIKMKGSISPRDQRQAMFFENLMSAAEQHGPQDILANATTGSGKTVAGIFMGWQLGYRTIIVVDSNKIASGWLKNFRQFFGQGWTERKVGRIQQDRCEWEDKAFSIALAQSLAVRDYGREFYRAFGLQIVDEVQVFGGAHFSQVLHMFPARVRVGFTAENRKGAFGRLIRSHLGDTRVVSKQEVLKPDAWIIRNKLKRKLRAFNDGQMLTQLAFNEERNEKLSKLITTRGFQRNRNVLVLSNRTRQLQYLRDMCAKRGVPIEVMGIHAGTYQTDRYVVYYKYQGSKKLNRLCVCDSYYLAGNKIRDAVAGRFDNFESFPTALYNRLQAGDTVRFSSKREEYSPTQNELDNITHSCQIIFATYEIFSKGVDVPRLDMGVEALPAGNIRQPVGRVLRVLDGKATPEWYAIHDYIETPKPDENDPFPAVDHDVQVQNRFFGDKTKARIAALKVAGARIKRQ
jgi:superfamily II DNA or RNA helicase